MYPYSLVEYVPSSNQSMSCHILQKINPIASWPKWGLTKNEKVELFKEGGPNQYVGHELYQQCKVKRGRKCYCNIGEWWWLCRSCGGWFGRSKYLFVHWDF